MSATRDRLLDAFEGLLIAHGPRAATLDAVAAAAEVSKGGLLYHFPSKSSTSTLVNPLENYKRQRRAFRSSRLRLGHCTNLSLG
jgi:AcrR family transcriptional regulator